MRLHTLPHNASRTAGFTLLELMVSLVMLAILAMVAAPSFTDTMKRNRVESTIREVSGALNQARTAAASRGLPVIFCRSTNAAANTRTCSGSTGATEGWIIFEDSDKDGTLDAGEPILRVHNSLTTTRLDVANSSGTSQTQVTFNRSGFSNQRLTFEVCESSRDTQFARALVMENTGRLAHSRINTGTGIFKDVGGNDLTCP